MKWTNLIFCLAVAAGPSPAVAADCEDPMTQADMNICAGRDYEQADASLNQVYRDVLARLPAGSEGRGSLRDAQRAWIAFRDAECAFRTVDSREGSIHPMLLAGCLKELTDARTEDLRRVLECGEEVTCP